jgi:hypothetical protein
MINFESMDLDDLITKRKKQAEIDLINQGQIPYYLAQNRLIDQGQIPHYQAWNRLMDQGQIPHYQTQIREINEKIKNPLLNSSGPAGQIGSALYLLQHPELLPNNQQPSQNNGGNRTSNARPLPLSEEQERRINENFARTGFANQIDPSKFGSVMDALNATQGQPAIAPQQQNNPYPFTPVPQRLSEVNNHFNQPSNTLQQRSPQKEEAPQYLAEANQKFQTAMQPAAQQSGQVKTGNQYADTILNSLNTTQDKNAALTAYYNIKNKSYAYDKLPMLNKSMMLAQANSFGINNDEASRAFANGVSLSDMAEAKGYDRKDKDSWPVPEFVPEHSVIARQQMANVAQEGIKAIDGDLTRDLAPYARTWNGQSLNSIYEATTGENVTRRGKALGAAALQIELASLRARQSGIQNIGIELLKESLLASGNDIKQLGATIDPKVYTIAQNYIFDHLKSINKAENLKLKSLHRTSGPAYERETAQQNNDDPLGLFDE